MRDGGHYYDIVSSMLTGEAAFRFLTERCRVISSLWNDKGVMIANAGSPAYAEFGVTLDQTRGSTVKEWAAMEYEDGRQPFKHAADAWRVASNGGTATYDLESPDGTPWVIVWEPSGHPMAPVVSWTFPASASDLLAVGEREGMVRLG